MANQNKNKKFTFNIIDALIILFFVVIIALIVYVFILGKDLKDLISSNDNDAGTKEAKIIEPSTLNQAIVSNVDFEYDESIVEGLL